jgi:hypothetical protein
MDNERALKTEDIRFWLEQNEISVKYFPPYLGAIMNPCDNSFNASFKEEYYRIMAGYSEIDEVQKVCIGERAYYKISDDGLINMFKHVGIVNNPSAKAATTLLSEGRMLREENLKIHRSQILLFLKWACTHKFETFVFKVRSLNTVPHN